MARIDHVVIAVKDPDDFTASLFTHCGLASYKGGRLAGETFSLLLCKSIEYKHTNLEVPPRAAALIKDTLHLPNSADSNKTPTRHWLRSFIDVN
jgi:hypothetical protein